MAGVREMHAAGSWKGPWNVAALEAGKGKETDSSLEPPEGAQLCSQFDFSQVRPVSDL